MLGIAIGLLIAVILLILIVTDPVLGYKVELGNERGDTYEIYFISKRSAEKFIESWNQFQSDMIELERDINELHNKVLSESLRRDNE